MAVTRIKNNQITDATVVANAKLVDHSISSAKLANNLVYGSDLTISGNLTVNGNTTTIDTTITTIEDPVILLASGQTSGAPAVDIGFVGARGSSSNIAFVWNEANDEFVTAFTSTGETNTTITITSYANFHTQNANIAGNLTVGGNIDIVGNVTNLTVTGNVVGGNLLTQGVVSANGNVTGGNVTTAGAVSATGTVTGGNVATAGTVSATGDVTGGNVATSGTVSATGNVTGGNVNTAGLISATANIIGGNVLTAGLISSTGNLTSGNINTGGQIGATGNINSGANIVATADIIGGNVATAGTVSATGNVTGGNVLTAGLVSATGNINSGANIVATANVIGGNVSTAGQVTASGNVTGGNLVTAGQVTATGNVTGGNVLTAGLISSTGNVTGGNLLTTGLISTSGNVQGANIIATNAFIGNIDLTGDIVANSITSNTFVSASGNVTGSNLFTAGNVSAAGNVTANNVNTDNVYSTAGLTITAASGDIALDTSGNINALNNYINNLLDPVQAQDAATKEYVDNAVSTGITIHEPVRVESPTALNGTYVQGGTTATVTATVAGNTVVFGSAISPQVNDQLWFTNSFEGIVANTPYFVVSAPNTSAAILSTTYSGAPVTNITSNTGLTQAVRINSGQGATLTNAGANATLVIDGVTVSNTNRVLIYTQANAVHNGVYVVSEAGNATTAWQLTRSSDMDTYIPDDINGLDAGDYFYVQQGDTGAGESYVMTAPIGPTIIGYANLTFTQFSASQVYTANTAAGLSLTGTVFSAKIDNNTTAFDGGGNIIVKASANLTTPNIGAATGTSLSTTGNVTGGNVLTGGLISTAGNISATGNVTAAYFIGEGSALANISKINNGTSYANIATANGNLDIQIAGANTWSFNNLGEIAFPNGGTIKSTLSGGANTGISITTTGGQISSLAHDANNFIFLNDNGVFLQGGAANNRVSLANTLFSVGPTTTVDMEVSGYLAVDEFISANGNVFGGNVDSGGIVSAVGNVIGGNISTAGQVTATGNITGGNVLTGGLISATTTITGGNLATGGTASATGNITGGNVLTGGLISATGTITSANTITGGNLATGGTASATGNITGGNVLTGGLISSTGNINSGANIVATANVIGGNISTAGQVTASGNVTGGNLILTGAALDTTAGRLTVNSTSSDADFAVNGDTVANVFYVDAGTGTVGFGSSAQTVNAVVAFNATNSVLMPVGNTAQRPATGVTGMLRFNSTDNNFEVYDNSQWSAVGVPEFTVIADDQFAGDGSTVAFTIGTDQTTNSCIVSINGVVQIPVTAYAVAGTTLTFTEAPQAGDVIDVRQITTTTTVTALSNSSGNAVIEVSDSTNNVNVTGDLVPSSNITQDLGTTSLRWKDLYLSGNSIILGNTVIKNTSGNSIGFFGPNGTTPATIDAASVDTTQIASGTSNVKVVSSNGNVTTSVGGTSNVVVVSNTGVAVAGTVSATGNITGSYVLGNGSQLTGIDATSIQNGTANVRTFLDGNVTTSAAGTANVVVVTSTGTVTTGTASVTGTVSGGNVLTAGLVSATGNITGGNILINGNAVITGNLSVSGTETIFNVANLTVNDKDIIVANNVTGGANVDGSGIQAGNPGVATWFFHNATTSWQSNISITPTSNGVANLGGASNFFGNAFVSTASVTGNVQGGNIRTAGLISATGAITGAALNGTSLTVGTGTVTAGNIVNSNANGVGNIGSSTTFFNTVFAKATSAQYADLAEKYTADAEYAPGTVVVFGGSAEVTVDAIDSDRRVAGVVSTNPSYIMNAGCEGTNVATVALTGRVPCLVTGTVRKGDLMVAAGLGRARAEADPRVGTVIGKALEDFNGVEGTIEVVVGRF